MMNKAKYFRYFKYVLSFALIFTICSCSDDVLYPDRNSGPEGEDSELSLSLTLSDMTKLTRAALDEDDQNRVMTLWVGIFNANSKTCTFNRLLTDGQNGFRSDVKSHTGYRLTDIDTKSGNSYIVAVANPHSYMGMTAADKNPQALTKLLENATDWDSYKSIIVTGSYAQDDAISVETPSLSETSGLLMSGIYADAADSPHPVVAETPVYISPGNASLNGAIHLRRLMSHITFNMKATGDIIDLQPLSFQVHNVAFASWLHEHTDGTLNAGDALGPDYADNSYYPSSLRMTASSFTKTDVDGGRNYSFDFWQLENKRTGLDNCTSYGMRDREFGADGSYYPEDANANYGQSGLFVSLTSFENPSLNNKATYVEIPCVVTYKAPTTQENATGGVANDPDKLLEPGAVRTANITYRIHLGYINDDAKDFNTYRNSEYTYNVTVKDLSNVIVEAFREGDEQPGAFGDVTDVSDHFFSLDAHYGKFNIYLSATDLEDFSFRMVSYEDNVAHEIKGGLEFDPLTDEDKKSKFYTWVSLLPTNSEDEQVMAAYPQDKNTLLHLGDFIPKGMGQASQKAGWYTVFVDEYAYEDGPDETGGNWKKYVNQPDRMFWLNVAQKISTDGASSYYKAKYAGSQRSIQTYYNVDSNVASAIGVEHSNENFGFNLRWTATTDNLSADNGRYNVWSKLPTGRRWSSVVSTTNWQRVAAITNGSVQTNITSEQRSGGFRNVPQMVFLTSGINADLVDGSFSNSATAVASSKYDPQTEGQYVQAIYSCMNRNRDENGDGVIDANELKWYLPASGKYLRVILGRNSLTTPIMSYSNNESLPFGAAKNGANGIFHLISSDNKIVWADEGLSSSIFTSGPYSTAPWHVRCIRNLGTDLTQDIESDSDGVIPAYKVYENPEGTGAIIRVPYYYGTSLRNPSDRPLPLHKTNSDFNKLGYYGFEVSYRGNQSTSGNSSYSEVSVGTVQEYEAYVNEPKECEALNSSTGRTGWRVPNQKELAIMGRINGLLDMSGLPYFWSCTLEYWDKDTGVATEGVDITRHRVTTITQNGNGDRVATAQQPTDIKRLRCVRDLQAGDFPDYR